MALEFGQRKRPEETFRDELRILAVQIETINQQLASGVGGGGPANSKALTDLNAKISFLYEYLKTMDVGFRQEAKSSMEQVQQSVNATLHKNLADIYAKQEEILKASGKASPENAGNPNDIEDMRNTLKELISVYREEVEVFKQQNQFLQKKLVDIEIRLQRMEK